ncbi:MAG: RNA polymerase subunit sigma-24, partial [Planctomycetes bacterium]|nr:RNA polymerase subunit sigma-24 [Planctomycetota bacterium]
MAENDVELMLQFQQGDDAAFESLVKQYHKRVLNTIARYTGDRTESEDLTQEVFLRIYNARQSYKPTSKFTS